MEVQANVEQQEAPATNPTVGIIYPPPELRNIVDKTASFVARNGPDFESRIKENEKANVKFNFLNPGDPYHAYYKFKINEFQETPSTQNIFNKMGGLEIGGSHREPFKTNLQEFTKKVAQAKRKTSIYQIQMDIPKEAPPEFEFIADPPTISAQDLDIVKLTAQFVAHNGRQFLSSLMHREARNFQFDFLRPQHSLFNYFTKLVEQYTKILLPPKDMVDRLKKESEDVKIIVQEVKKRELWLRQRQQERQRAEDMAEKERLAYAQIDWHDFVVVETVDFQANEAGNFPHPTTPEQVGMRVLMQERVEDEERKKMGSSFKSEMLENTHKTVDLAQKIIEEELAMEEEAESLVKHQEASKPSVEKKSKFTESFEERQRKALEDRGGATIAAQPVPLPPEAENLIIKKNYDPKLLKVQAQTPSVQYLISPITGEKVPAHKMQEHLRYGLLDPQWLEQREKSLKEKKEQEEVYATGISIGSSLKKLAERRTDIFGAGHKETYIGKKLDERPDSDDEDVFGKWEGQVLSKEPVINPGARVLAASSASTSTSSTQSSAPKYTGIFPPHSAVKSTLAPVSAAHTNNPSTPASTTAPPTLTTLAPPPVVASVTPILAPPPILLGPPPLPMMFGAMAAPPPPLLLHPAPPAQTAPPTKKAKLGEESTLVPESEFLANNPSPVQFNVKLPVVPDKPEWNLNGQILSFSLPLSDNVSVIKAKIYETISMPAGKQKLQYQGIFIKDSNTLAFYNFTNNCNVELSLKERGGRKK